MELTVVFTLGILLAIAAGFPALALRAHLGRRLREEKEHHTAFERRVEAEASDATFTVDEMGCIRSFNSVAERLFGYPAKEIIGRSIGTLIPLANGGTTGSHGINSLHTGQRTVNGIGLEVTGKRKFGTYIPLDLSLTERMENGRRLFHAVARDLTERHASERNAREAQFLGGVLNSIGTPLLVLDRDGKVVKHNPAFEQITDYREGEAAGRHYWEVLLPEEEWSRMKVTIAQLIASGGKENGEFIWRKRNGEIVPVYLAMTAVRSGNAPAEHAVIVGVPIPEAQGQEFISSMEAVERLAGGIAQQFNDLLTSISGYSELVLFSLADEDPLRRDVEEIKKAGDRATALTSQLLAFSRKQPMKTGPFNLNTLINSMKSMLDMLLGDKIQVSTILDLNLGMMNTDSGWMEQVILNLAVNARDAMPAGGRLAIETTNVTMDAVSARRTAQLPAGDYVLLSVSDTGCGIEPSIRQHMFEPFYTTKRPGKGMGLGLSTVYGVVRQSGGNVVVQSIPGSGASVKIYMPLYAETDQQDQAGRGLFLVRGASAGR